MTTLRGIPSTVSQIAAHQAGVYSVSAGSESADWQDALLRHKTDAIESCLAEVGMAAHETIAILDVGCNDGSLLAGLAAPGRQLFGLDLSPECVELAVRRHGINALPGDVSRGLPWRSETFDVVVCSEIVEHLYDTDAFFSETWRVLNKAGLVVVTNPNINCLRNRFRVPLGRYPFGPGYSDGGRGHGVHIRVYNLRALAEQLAGHGFHVVRRWSTHLLPIRVSTKRWGYRLNRILGRLLPTLGSDIIVVGRKS